MMSTKLFPAILIILDICAAIVWLCNGNIRQAVYWIAAAILTVTVTF